MGHPEHGLLFIATQVGTAAGLKHAKRQVQREKVAFASEGKAIQVHEALGKVGNLSTLKPKGIGPRWMDSWLFTESATYQMLLRGHAPHRKWVTEEVLPSIRKTGSYNVNESTSETGQKFAGELAELHAIITGFQEAVMARFGHQEEAILAKPNGFYRQDTAIQI